MYHVIKLVLTKPKRISGNLQHHLLILKVIKVNSLIA